MLLIADQRSAVFVGQRALQDAFHLVDHGAEGCGDLGVALALRPPSVPFRTPCVRLRDRLMRRENFCVSITIPSTPEGTSSESFFTSSPARPKIACSSFSSGVSSVFDFGETLPTRMSPGRT